MDNVSAIIEFLKDNRMKFIFGMTLIIFGVLYLMGVVKFSWASYLAGILPIIIGLITIIFYNIYDPLHNRRIMLEKQDKSLKLLWNWLLPKCRNAGVWGNVNAPDPKEVVEISNGFSDVREIIYNMKY